MFYTRAFEKLMKSSFNSFLAINKYQKHENAVFNSGWVADRSVKRRAIFFECDHWFRFVWFKKPKFLYKSMIWKIVKYTCLVFENRSCFFSCSNRFFYVCQLRRLYSSFHDARDFVFVLSFLLFQLHFNFEGNAKIVIDVFSISWWIFTTGMEMNWCCTSPLVLRLTYCNELINDWLID